MQGHPANRNVLLRRMPLPGRSARGGNIEVIARLSGGQGTINVNSWSPDGQYLAFVSYQAISE